MGTLGRDLLSSLVYRPKLNPEAHLDPSGNIVDSTGKPTTLYVSPNFAQRWLSPQAQQVDMLNQEGSALPLETQQRAALARNQWVNNVYNPRAGEFGMPADAAYSETLYPSTTIAAQRQAAFGNKAGTPELLGSSDLNTAKTMLSSTGADLNRVPVMNAIADAQAANKLHQATNLDPLTVQHGINTMGAQLAQDPTEAAINELNNKYTLGMTRQNVTDLPLITGTTHLGRIAENYNAQTIPDISTAYPFKATVSPTGVTPSGGMINPSYKSPQDIEMAKIQQLMGGGSGGTPMTLSSGKTISYNPPPTPQQEVAPVYGSGYSRRVTSLEGYEPIEGYDGYYMNPSTGRIVLNGQDITNHTPEPVRTAAIEQSHMKANEHVDSIKKAQKADVAAKLAALKAEQAKLDVEHTKYTPLNTAASAANNMIGFNPDDTTGNINPFYHALGVPARLIGNMTSNLHPIGDIKRAYKYLTSPY